MASVGNGHVATVVDSDTVYMNGLYNGGRGESHRARIPSRINIHAIVPDEGKTVHRFILDTEQGKVRRAMIFVSFFFSFFFLN